MDHKVSKDMISSGMIPSGEKTQADLGRIQYGSAPSPSSLMDAYKSMYEKKEEVINEMASFKKLSGRQKRIQRTPRGGSRGSGVYDATTGGKNDSQSIDPKVSNVSGPGQGKPMVGKVTTRKVDPQTLKTNPRGDIQTNSFDLLAAYHAVYEHHKKDADGNTIPHEGEELNENLAGIAAKGLQMASRGASKMSQMAAKGSVRARQLQAQGGVKKAIGDKLQSAKKKTALTSGQKEALLGRTTAGKITRGVAALGAANIAGRMASGNDKPSGGYYYRDLNFGYTPEGDTISEDLFDALKSALIEEGCDDKNVMKIMASVTPDYFDEIIQEENIDEAIVTGSVLAGLAAKKLLAGAIAKKVGAVALKKGIGAAAKTGARLGSKYVAQKGGKMAAAKAVTGEAGKGIMSAGKNLAKTAAKKPVETALVGSMAMPQGGGGAAQPQAQRAVTSGKRTAGMRTMSLDLFDVVKGQLLDEGLTEEEVLDVMTTLTLDEIQEGMGKLALKTGAVVAGGVLAKKGLDKAKEKVDDALNKARDNSPIGGNKRPGADKIYFGK